MLWRPPFDLSDEDEVERWREGEREESQGHRTVTWHSRAWKSSGEAAATPSHLLDYLR